jgi:hypothetical protein
MNLDPGGSEISDGDYGPNFELHNLPKCPPLVPMSEINFKPVGDGPELARELNTTTYTLKTHHMDKITVL